jgi:hypothetical protein
LAREKEIDRGYLNAIIQGRKTGSEHVRGKIAEHFHLPYEEMLALGRRLLEAPGPQRGPWTRPGVKRSSDNAAKVPEGTGDIFRANTSTPRISETIRKALIILESDTEYRNRLADLINTFHDELMAREEPAGLRTQLTEMEKRIAHLENMLADEKKGTRKSA